MKLVIFDCDGVLVDTETIANQVIVDSLKNYGLRLTLAQCMTYFVGLTTENVKIKAGNLGAILPDSWVEDIDAEDQKRCAEGVPFIDGIFEVIAQLEAAKMPFCVASNGRSEKMLTTLGHTGLLPHFAGAMYSARDLDTAKPDPKLFLHAAAKFAVNPDDCVVIEDSAAGATAARRAGMKCFGYAPHDDGATLIAEGAKVFDDMAKLPTLLGLAV